MNLPRKLLVIEDDAHYRLTLTYMLRDEPYEIVEADSPREGIAIADADPEIQVVVLDLSFPNETGSAFLEYSRRTAGRDYQIIILTSHEKLLLANVADEYGVFAYLPKADRTTGEALRFALRQAFRQLERLARTPRGPRPRLLILDSDPQSLQNNARMLDRDFELVLTTSAEEAYKKLGRQPFALAILTSRGRQASELNLLNQMRKIAPELRAIVLAEEPNYAMAFESGRQGALNYVGKTDWPVLAEKVSAALSQSVKTARLFLSYEKSDRASVSRVFRKLTARGFLPWMDCQSIAPGKQWEPEIRKTIEAADYFLCFLSNNSIGREGMMRKEIHQALDRQRGMLEDRTFFIPVRLELCDVGEPFSRFQYVDLFRRNGFDKLLGAISA